MTTSNSNIPDPPGPSTAPTAPTSPAAPARSRTSARMAVVVSCVALFTDMLVYGILIPLLPLMPAVERAGSSATGLLFAAYAAMMIAVTPLAGRLVAVTAGLRASSPRDAPGRAARGPAGTPRPAARRAPRVR